MVLAAPPSGKRRSFPRCAEAWPFQAPALSFLRTTLASQGLDPGAAGEIVESLADLPRVSRSGGGPRAALEKAGLAEHIAHVRPRRSRHISPTRGRTGISARRLNVEPAQAALVAAHVWDVLGARSAGYDAIWIDRTERCWPQPSGEPARRVHDLEHAASLLVGTLATR
jgi:hypothetical protein